MPVPFQTNVLCPFYRHLSSGEQASRIDHFPKQFRVWGEKESGAFLRMETVEESTCFEGITRIIPPPPELQRTLEETLASFGKGTVVALSGGLDSFLIVALIHRLTGQWPAAATLVSHLDRYCEYQHTREMARTIGLKNLEAFETSAEEFVEALPDAVRAAEVPFYNLHPVSKWLFAQKALAAGYTGCITGDGVDQLFTHDNSHDYLPLVGAMFAHSGMKLHCPFYRSDSRPSLPDPEKLALRKLAKDFLPHEIVAQQKVSCFAPPMDLSRYAPVSQHLSDREKSLLVTSSILKKSHS